MAQRLDKGIAAHRCAGLVLVASSPFLGHPKAHLGEQAKKAVVRTLDADYTALDDRELAQRQPSVFSASMTRCTTAAKGDLSVV